MNFSPSERGASYLARLQQFLADHVIPAEAECRRQNREINPGTDWSLWRTVPPIEALKAKAREAGLWNLFLPDAQLGAGLTTLEPTTTSDLTTSYSIPQTPPMWWASWTGNLPRSAIH